MDTQARKLGVGDGAEEEGAPQGERPQPPVRTRAQHPRQRVLGACPACLGCLCTSGSLTAFPDRTLSLLLSNEDPRHGG